MGDKLQLRRQVSEAFGEHESCAMRGCPHRERGPIDAIGVHIHGGGWVFPLQEVHAARQVSVPVVQQANRVARAEVHVVYENHPIRVPPRRLALWPLQQRPNPSASSVSSFLHLVLPVLPCYQACLWRLLRALLGEQCRVCNAQVKGNCRSEDSEAVL